jgi:hypothetical protein
MHPPYRQPRLSRPSQLNTVRVLLTSGKSTLGAIAGQGTKPKKVRRSCDSNTGSESASLQNFPKAYLEHPLARSQGLAPVSSVNAAFEPHERKTIFRFLKDKFRLMLLSLLPKW